MAARKSDPWEFTSLDDLLAIAGSMEQEAIDGYVALSQRMTGMGRPDLAAVFDSLVLEETGHLGKVHEWREALGQQGATVEVDAPDNLFDDEGAGIVAPELLTAYRAFSMAVRNEERAFTFWSYVSAHAQSEEIRQAAERMAREELGHVARLRRERRKAFHLERDRKADAAVDLVSLEERLLRCLAVMAASADGDIADILHGHSNAARARMEWIVKRPLDADSAYSLGSQTKLETALPLAEFLLDCYLEAGDHAKSEKDADVARGFAAQLIACIRTFRGIPG